MQKAYTLILVDNDTRRRSGLSHTLSSHGMHVEPFETVAELATCWPCNGTVLIHDSEGDVALLIEEMARHGEWYPIIAFAEQPDAARIVRAITEGAVDYLVWPINPRDCRPYSKSTMARPKVSAACACGRLWLAGVSKS